jgi:hypothetical protein
LLAPRPANVAAEAQRLLDLPVSFGDIDETPPDGKLPPGTFFARTSS